jgi:calcineurin-like phosphoesterase family protein
MFKAFYSDPHLGHANIIKYCNRPFSSIDEMNDSLVANYNSVIEKTDCVLWLGDCFFKGNIKNYTHILHKMNGYKILILGNHDQSGVVMASIGFEMVLREAVLNINGIICRASHYSYETYPTDKYAGMRPPKKPGEILLHGHNHSTTKITSNQSINVGVDAWDYGPALYSDVSKLVCELHGQING